MSFYDEAVPDDSHTFRWMQPTSRSKGHWGTVWTDRRRPRNRWTGERAPRHIRLHMRTESRIEGRNKTYSVAHNLSRQEAWRIGWALIVRALTR